MGRTLRSWPGCAVRRWSVASRASPARLARLSCSAPGTSGATPPVGSALLPPTTAHKHAPSLRSHPAGKTVRELQFRSQFNGVVVAISRQGERIQVGRPRGLVKRVLEGREGRAARQQSPGLRQSTMRQAGDRPPPLSASPTLRPAPNRRASPSPR